MLVAALVAVEVVVVVVEVVVEVEVTGSQPRTDSSALRGASDNLDAESR